MNILRYLVLLVPAFLFGSEIKAQEKYGADSVKCVSNISLYREYYKQKNYKDATPHWRWVYQNCPASTEHMYADGPNLLKVAMQNEKDPVRLNAYKDSILSIYDQRIQYFGKEGYVLSRKMIEILTLYPEKQDTIFKLGQKVYELEGAGMDPSAATVWFQSAMILMGKNGLNSEEVMNIYEKVMEIAGSKTSNYYQQNLKTVEDLFIESPLATCEVMVPNYTKKYEADPTNLEQNKKIASVLGPKCADSDLFFKVSQAVYSAEPSAEAAYNLARMSVKKDNYSAAAKYYNEAIEKETDNDKKAQYYYELAGAQVKSGQSAAAKANAQKAANLRPGWGDPYILIGELIATTKGCGETELEQKSVFWLAVDKFQKAKSVDPSVAGRANDRIATYSQYFPALEVIFFNNYKEGDTFNVTCLGETTTVRAKK